MKLYYLEFTLVLLADHGLFDYRHTFHVLSITPIVSCNSALCHIASYFFVEAPSSEGPNTQDPSSIKSSKTSSSNENASPNTNGRLAPQDSYECPEAEDTFFCDECGGAVDVTVWVNGATNAKCGGVSDCDSIFRSRSLS